MAVGRFQVMAILQAARAFCLGMKMEEAKSWGLNRAIFYAAAKKGFIRPKPGPPKPPRLKVPKEVNLEAVKKSYHIHNLGDEMAYAVEIKGKKLFTIGDTIQTPEDFDRQVASRFGRHFGKAWQEAVKICQNYDKGVLLSQRYFYETVYKPRRDELAKKWSEL
jgi:hypothetical protein|uniref:Uncharacterized protein n=1 Tax=candidate division WOR-3 bacterium TaxID=2052148 RepID=A0A7C3YPF7_UNCW3